LQLTNGTFTEVYKLNYDQLPNIDVARITISQATCSEIDE